MCQLGIPSATQMLKQNKNVLEDNILLESKGLSNILRTWPHCLHPSVLLCPQVGPHHGCKTATCSSRHKAWPSTGLSTQPWLDRLGKGLSSVSLGIMAGPVAGRHVMEDMPSRRACRAEGKEECGLRSNLTLSDTQDMIPEARGPVTGYSLPWGGTGPRENSSASSE